MHDTEAALMEGTVVGTTSSVAYGRSVGSILAFARVKPEAAVDGCEREVMIMGEAGKAMFPSAAAYNPENTWPRSDV